MRPFASKFWLCAVMLSLTGPFLHSCLADEPTGIANAAEQAGNGDTPADSNADKPADSTPDKPADSTADKPADSTADKPADSTADKPADSTADKPADSNADKPADTSTVKLPEEAIQQARQDIARKRFADAKLVLKQCLSTNPQNVPLYMELYDASVKSNDWSDALSSLEKVMEIDLSKEKDVYADYGYTLYKLKRYDKAKLAFARALGFGKNKEMIHKTLIQIALQQKDEPSVDYEYKEYLKIKPTDGDMHWEYANFLYKGKKIKESIPEYKLAAQNRPNDSYGHAFLAQLLLVDKDYDGAIAEYKKAISTCTTNPEPLRDGLKYALAQKKALQPQVPAK